MDLRVNLALLFEGLAASHSTGVFEEQWYWPAVTRLVRLAALVTHYGQLIPSQLRW